MLIALKTVKQDEPVARSRFVDCPNCKNHTFKLKRTIQVGRCKTCNESYKLITVYVKSGRKTKPETLSTQTHPETKQENRPEAAPESSLPSWQLPSDSSLFGSTSETYRGLSEAVFGEKHHEKGGESGSSSS